MYQRFYETIYIIQIHRGVKTFQQKDNIFQCSPFSSCFINFCFRQKLQYHDHSINDTTPSGHVHESHQGDRRWTQRTALQNE